MSAATETPTPKAVADKKEEEEKTAETEMASPKKETDDKKRMEVLTEATQHILAGKRHLLCQDVKSAVASMEQATMALAEHFGETAKECGEAYFFYGKALLELARIEGGVIENALDGDESEENSEESEEEEPAAAAKEGEEEKKDADSADADKPEGSEDKPEGSADKLEGSEDAADASEENGDGNESIASNEAGTSEVKDSADQGAIEEEEEDDPSSLQLAWEVLEMAKVCLQKQSDSLDTKDPRRLDAEKRLSETYQTLGEVSIENENYEGAIDDLNQCLDRRRELLPEDDRSIAETHYQLGVAMGFALDFDGAVGHLEEAIQVLEKKIENLANFKDQEKDDKEAKSGDFLSPKEKREQEIKDIKLLLPAIKEKIEDTRDMQRETVKKLGDRALMEEQEVTNGGLGAGEASNGDGASNVLVTKRKSASGQGKSSSKVATEAEGDSSSKAKDSSSKAKDSNGVSDISHMVKKRKPESSDAAKDAGAAAAGTPTKKAKVDDAKTA